MEQAKTTLKPTNMVFYYQLPEGAICIHDCVVEDAAGKQVGQFSGKTLEELMSPERQMMMGVDVEVIKQIEDAHTTIPVVIDEEQFTNMLEVLPPVRWRNSGEFESFRLVERITYAITSIYGRVGKVYMTFNGRIDMPDAEVEKSFRDALAKLKVGA